MRMEFEPLMPRRNIRKLGIRKLEHELNRGLADKRCPAHHKPPRVSIRESGGRLTPQVTTCCAEFQRKVKVSIE